VTRVSAVSRETPPEIQRYQIGPFHQAACKVRITQKHLKMAGRALGSERLSQLRSFRSGHVALRCVARHGTPPRQPNPAGAVLVKCDVGLSNALSPKSLVCNTELDSRTRSNAGFLKRHYVRSRRPTRFH
jgi:hypothetical protein